MYTYKAALNYNIFLCVVRKYYVWVFVLTRWYIVVRMRLRQGNRCLVRKWKKDLWHEQWTRKKSHTIPNRCPEIVGHRRRRRVIGRGAMCIFVRRTEMCVFTSSFVTKTRVLNRSLGYGPGVFIQALKGVGYVGVKVVNDTCGGSRGVMIGYKFPTTAGW